MREYIITGMDVNHYPIGTTLTYALDRIHALQIGRDRYPNAVYWEVGIVI